MIHEKYWRIVEPTPERRKDSFVSGEGSHPLALPGLYCPVCNHTWGGTRVLPFECPVTYQDHPSIVNPWPIPEEQHRALRDELTSALKDAGVNIAELRPGDGFQPLEIEFPSRPKGDFLWAALGGPVVSERTRDLFEEHEVNGVRFCPVHISKVGRKQAYGPIHRAGARQHTSGIALPANSFNGVGPLYEMVIVAESGRPPGTEVTSRCTRCGKEEFDDTKRQFALTRDIIPDADIFYLATTLWIIVNATVRQLVLRNQLTNVEFQEMEYIDG